MVTGRSGAELKDSVHAPWRQSRVNAPTPIRIAFERVEFDVAMNRSQFARPQ
jgi:hypothetical protein